MGIYPDDWKVARVLPIFKSGDKCDLGNYRPISIICAIAKSFGRPSDRFYTYLTDNQLIRILINLALGLITAPSLLY
jgi:hypothetical protein